MQESVGRSTCILAGERQKRFKLQHTGFEGAVQENDEAARGQVHVTAVRTTEISAAEMPATMGALEHRAEQSWSSHLVILSDEMNSVGGDALEIQ